MGLSDLRGELRPPSSDPYAASPRDPGRPRSRSPRDLKDPSRTSGVLGGPGGGLGSPRGPQGVLDVAALILHGCQALPIRLKILLDRLFSALPREDVLQLLHGLGWTYDDYSRGYKLKDRQGAALHSWNMMKKDEETLVLRHFLR